jgi:hypothetical protein
MGQVLLKGPDEGGATFLAILPGHPGLVQDGAHKLGKVFFPRTGARKGHHLFKQLRGDVRHLQKDAPEPLQPFRPSPVVGALREGVEHL